MWAKVKSTYFNHPSQGNSTNYYLILGLRDKAAPPTSQQIPSKTSDNLATPSSIFIFVFSSSTRELCSQPIRGNDRPIGQMFPEHAERRFLDPEYSFDKYFKLGSRRKVGSNKNQLASPNTSNLVREETFAQLRTGFRVSQKKKRKHSTLYILTKQILQKSKTTGNSSFKRKQTANFAVSTSQQNFRCVALSLYLEEKRLYIPT